MLKKIFIPISIILSIFLILFILRFVIGGSEDSWICVNGKWIEHGVPSAPKPTKFCGHKDIKILSPKVDEEISGLLIIKGRARGYWFFEGDAPISLLDGNGTTILSGFISSKDKWMVDNFVDFDGGFELETIETATGTLIFMKANPSGIPELDEWVRVPIRFKQDICEDKCGDGECQEIVCLGTGCPCSESAEKCQEDCKYESD